MFMRKMRSSAALVMGIMAAAFVGWLVFDGINAMQGGNLGGQVNPVVGQVGGRDIRYAEWNIFLQNRLDVARQGRSMTDEDVRVATENAWESLVNTTLVAAELDRLGVNVTDEEVRQAFMTQPPQQFMSYPAFQTDGQFDIEKYRQFFTDPTTDETRLLEIENYYRSILPQRKLQTLVESGIYVPDEEAWQHYLDTNERATVRYVSLNPSALVPDSAVTVPEDEVRELYNERAGDLIRPASARVNHVSVTIEPTAGDSISARERIDALAERVRGGEAFATLAMAESEDSVTAAIGGSMGRRPASEFDPLLAEAALAAEAGGVTGPVETPAGFHLLLIEGRAADTLALRQIFVGYNVSGATEDSVFALLDSVEDVALLSDLTTATDSLGLELRTDIELVDGSDFVAGAGQLGVAREWAFGPEAEIGEVSEWFENPTGFHLFELLGIQDEGVIPFEDAADGLRQELLEEKKREAVTEMAAPMLEAVAGGTSLEEAATQLGWAAQMGSPFRRGDFVPGLGSATEAIGYAFGAPVGSVSGVLDAGNSVVVLEIVEREDGTQEGFEEVKEALRSQLRTERSQQYVTRWLAALRESAIVEDHRERLLVPENANPFASAPLP